MTPISMGLGVELTSEPLEFAEDHENPVVRVTEDDDERITEDGDLRVTES